MSSRWLNVDVQIIFNGEPREVDDRLTIANLLAQLQLTARHVAVEVNLEVVPRDAHPRYVLQPGDRLEIVTLVGGG